MKNNKIFISTKIPRSSQWTPYEDELLISLALHYSEKNWIAISQYFIGKKPSQCRARYKRIRPGIIKGSWSTYEDELIVHLVETYGRNWSKIAKCMQTRNGKQIRDRFINYLDPEIKREKFTKEEDEYIMKMYVEYGSKWTLIAKNLKGRTGDMIKNRFYSTLKKKVIKDEGQKRKMYRKENDKLGIVSNMNDSIILNTINLCNLWLKSFPSMAFNCNSANCNALN